jgi:CRP-like cAMP-binding protein
LKARETLFEQGDEGDTFYIIYTGKVSVYINQVNEVSGETNRKIVAELNQGKSFGELSLLNNEKRSATIIAIEPTDLIVLDQNTYDRIVKGVQLNQIDSITEFFEYFPLFHSLSRKVLLDVATKVMHKRLPTNTIII